MRSPDTIARLAAVAPQTEPLVDAAEEGRILERIVASDRPGRPARHRRRIALAVVGLAVLAAAATVAALQSIQDNRTPTASVGRHHVVLNGAQIALAGYHFKTPRGFTPSDTSCAAATSQPNVQVGVDGFSAAASADGGCVEAFFMLSSSDRPIPPPGAEPVDVGTHQGYLDSPDNSSWTTLYVGLPKLGEYQTDLVLRAQGLTNDQLVAVARSGLPG